MSTHGSWYDPPLALCGAFQFEEYGAGTGTNWGGTSWLRDAGLLDTILMSEDQ